MPERTGPAFHLSIGSEVVDDPSLTAADVKKLVRERLMAQAVEHGRAAKALEPAVKEARRIAQEIANRPGTLLPEWAEELDKPWDPVAFANSPVGRYADARRIREAERSALSTLRYRQDRRAKHAAGGWGCGLDTVEYRQARREDSRLTAERDHHQARYSALVGRAKNFRVRAEDGTFAPVNRRKEAAALRRAAQPAKVAFAPGSWVRWTDPETGSVRFGVVTADPAAYTGPEPRVSGRTAVRYIVPADGGDALPMAARGPASAGAWHCQLPDWPAPTDVLPSLAQDGLFDLPAGGAETVREAA